MAGDTFTALLIEDSNGAVSAAVRTLEASTLPPGDVIVEVAYSDLNYKDGMVVKGLGRLVRTYPHIPGIDFSGTVIESASPKFKRGDNVILTGWRVGEVHWGGYATRARVKSEWLVPLPDGLDLKDAMAIGTAGFTAMLATMALEAHGLKPGGDGEVLVTGASGGVGSVAVALLAALGYRVAASTGRAETQDYLRELGAHVIVDRAELAAAPKGPLAAERWAGVIDNVGGPTLAHALAAIRHRQSCAAVGLASGPELATTVLPFLLRGVNLLGIDSAASPYDERMIAWRRLARELPRDKLKRLTDVQPLANVPDLAGKILQGKLRGRTVIDVNA
ncbi:MAG: oxidoreductase [Rhodospirillales bacterium]|nr:oxidoreductase [Rhodospirillales bacterium]